MREARARREEIASFKPAAVMQMLVFMLNILCCHDVAA